MLARMKRAWLGIVVCLVAGSVRADTKTGAKPDAKKDAPKKDEPKVVIDRTEQKARAKRIKKIDDEIAQLEARIANAEGERERNELLLCSQEVFRDGERVKKIQAQNAELKAMIDLLYGKWEGLAKEKEDLEGAVV